MNRIFIHMKKIEYLFFLKKDNIIDKAVNEFINDLAKLLRIFYVINGVPFSVSWYQ